jgi:hypothetical protein
VLEHAEDDRKALSETWRMLKDGGTCYLSVPLLWGTTTEEYGFAVLKRNHHYLIYGYDIVECFDRFHWERIDFKTILDEGALQRFGINPEEPLFELKKIPR